jgi:5'-nucleotidase/UDP-sugar diphosphatase
MRSSVLQAGATPPQAPRGHRRLQWAAALLFCLVMPAHASDPQAFQILYTNDIESVYEPLPATWRSDMTHIGGLPKLASLINTYRQRQPKTLLLDAGDLFTGSLSKATEGRLVFDLYSVMGYDAVNLGNHEFEYGWQTLAFVSQRARFPLLNGNIFYEGTDIPFSRAYAILNVGSLKVAVLGLMGVDAFLNTMMPSHRRGLTVVAPETVAAQWVPRLRAEADIVVLLTHQGRTAPMQTDKEADPEVQRGFEAEYALAGAVKGIDLIVAGHTDHGLRTPVRHPETQTLIVETFGQGMHLGVLNLLYQAGQPLTLVSSDLVPVNADRLPDDAAVAGLIQAARARHPELSRVAGVLQGHAPRKYYRESVVGNLVADALRASAKTIKLTGVLLKAIVEKGLWREYGLPQYSGMTLTADLAKPEGQRLVSLQINGLPVIDAGEYTLATGSFTATGGEGYHLLTDHIVAVSEALVSDVLVRYFEAKGQVLAPSLGRQTLRR